MRQPRISVVLLLVFGNQFAAAQVRPDAGALADAFARAWNMHDARAFGRLFAEDADWVMAAGARCKGGSAIEGALQKEHETWARTTTFRATDISVRAIDADHAIVSFKWELTNASDAGAPSRRGNTLLIAAKERGVWVIVSGQVARAANPA